MPWCWSRQTHCWTSSQSQCRLHGSRPSGCAARWWQAAEPRQSLRRPWSPGRRSANTSIWRPCRTCRRSGRAGGTCWPSGLAPAGGRRCVACCQTTWGGPGCRMMWDGPRSSRTRGWWPAALLLSGCSAAAGCLGQRRSAPRPRFSRSREWWPAVLLLSRCSAAAGRSRQRQSAPHPRRWPPSPHPQLPANIEVWPACWISPAGSAAADWRPRQSSPRPRPHFASTPTIPVSWTLARLPAGRPRPLPERWSR
mmetsp:Transcript_23820/g.75211  ORF Transcript_23820/g.75211 Transcript_23820/m.75211 type:complete len:252 (-) Transcript_23820:33-788(-)